jgi:ABC-2 type transport system permease protein
VVESVMMLFWLWMPLLPTMNAIADSIAGERERHTLETLLASRLPDWAILLGKMIIPVLQGWMMMLIAAVLALLTVNLTKGESEFVMYPLAVIITVLLLPLLVGLLVAGIGVIASTHATTVRQAYQRTLMPLFVLIVVPSLGLTLLPRGIPADLYSPEFAQTSLGGLLLLVIAVLVGLDAAMMVMVIRRSDVSN